MRVEGYSNLYYNIMPHFIFISHDYLHYQKKLCNLKVESVKLISGNVIGFLQRHNACGFKTTCLFMS